MDDLTLRFTVCWFVRDAWVDVHLTGAGDDAPERLGRLIFAGLRDLVVWSALAKVLREHGKPMIDGVSAIVVARAPDTINYQAIPPSIKRGMVDHIKQGAPTGGYLTAVLENDLARAIAKADEYSLAALRDTATWLWNNAPPESWGTREKVGQWRDAHRMAEALGAVEQGPGPTEATP